MSFTPPTTYTVTGPSSGGYYPGYTIHYDSSRQTGSKYYYGLGDSTAAFSGYSFYYDSSTNTWNDDDAGGSASTADPDSFTYST